MDKYFPSLPFELRTKIWHQVFSTRTLGLSVPIRSYDSSPRCFILAINLPAIARTCKEAYLIYAPHAEEIRCQMTRPRLQDQFYYDGPSLYEGPERYRSKSMRHYRHYTVGEIRKVRQYVVCFESEKFIRGTMENLRVVKMLRRETAMDHHVTEMVPMIWLGELEGITVVLPRGQGVWRGMDTREDWNAMARVVVFGVGEVRTEESERVRWMVERSLKMDGFTEKGEDVRKLMEQCLKSVDFYEIFKPGMPWIRIVREDCLSLCF